jgi:hypothetical protein
MAIRPEAEEINIPRPSLCYFKFYRNITVTEAEYISKTYYHTSLQDPEICTTNLTPTLQFRTSASALLMTVGN